MTDSTSVSAPTAMDLSETPPPGGVRRRHFLGYVLGGTTLVAAADLGLARPARADGVPSEPQIPEFYDLEDLQTDAALPTSQLISITINTDGTASFALPRMEVGQGITTSTAMIIAEELDISLDRVKVTLAKARPELIFNQLTGGSNSTFSTYTPIRVAAAVARRALLDAAAAYFDQNADRLEVAAGVITNTATGEEVTFGELAESAASLYDREVEVELKPEGEFSVIGTPRNRDDAMLAVTGQKDFSMDLEVKGAKPTMVCRPPQLNGTPRRLRNRSEILNMPGVKNVAKVSTGIAVRARTFGQCIDAIRKMKVDWNPGPVAGENDETILAGLRDAELPFTPVSEIPDLPLLDSKTFQVDCEFMFRSSAALEPYAAIADVRKNKARVWAGLKVPILAQQDIAQLLGMSQEQVEVNVITGGGSFGHKLFSDHALEAAEISAKMGKPVRLMWHRVDEPRQGRLHPMVTSRIRAVTAPVPLEGRKVFAYEQRNTSVVTDFSHGLGEILSSFASDDLPAGLGELTLSQSIFTLTQELGYDFGVVTQLLNETDDRFNTGSMRNIYSPDTRVAGELMVDALAKDAGKDPVEYRLEFLRNAETRKALEKVAEEGGWGRTDLPEGITQGVAIHKEYKGATACLVELDTRPATVNRKIRQAVTGPRVTKGVFAIDAGLVINPRGLEAQMIGGFCDGLALTLTSSVHLKAGHFLEASWDNYFYTRQWNMPFEFDVHVLPSDNTRPGGAGEAGVAASAAATACAYVRAMGIDPTQQTLRFPINHDTSLSKFRTKSFVPSVPRSPVNGLNFTY